MDDSWNFREISDERFLDVKAYVEYRTDMPYHPVYGNKVEVPCSKIITGPRLSGSDSALQASSKRKAEDEADAIPAPKRLIGGAVPRHISGLLSGVVAPTEDDDDDDAEGAGSPGRDSKRPSPTPQLADEEDDLLDDDDNGTPLGDEDGTARVKPSERLPPLPNGASEPDAYDVRLVNKRRTANFDVYNRILVPSLFDFEPHEIGFRDSTNDKSRGATKIKRGRFLGTPNSNTMHFDRSLWQYDATTYEEGELDEELVKKHSLHPKYGLVIRSSINEEEPPKKRVSGKNPIVFYTPHGRTLNSSRSIFIARLEDGAGVSAQRPAIAAAVDKFVEEEGVKADDVNAPADLLKDYREAKLNLWLGPRRVIRDETEEQEEIVGDAMEEEDDEKSVAMQQDAQDHSQPEQDEPDQERPASPSAQEDREYIEDSSANVVAIKDLFGTLLDAASTLKTEAAAEDSSRSINPSIEAHSAVAASSSSPPHPPRRAASKPFDPVRDVFMDSAPPVTSVEQPRQGSTDSRHDHASTLLLMANLASDRDYIPTYSRHQSQSQPPAPPPHYSYQPQPQSLPPSQAPLRYPSSRGGSQEYAPVEASSSTHPQPLPRSMSMDPPQPYHHQAPPPQPQHEATLLDPRLFGEATHQQSQNPVPSDPAPPYNAGREPSNGYNGSAYYPPQPSAFMHSNAPADPYGPPAPSRGSQSYYISPPPQHQPPPSQHIMRPYDNQYSPPQNQPAPPSSAYQAQQALPPMMSQGPPSPHAYTAQPPYVRRSSGEYQQAPHPYHGAANNGNLHNGPDTVGNGMNDSHDSNGANGSNKMRKLEPVPMAHSRSSEWPTGSDRDREHGNTPSNGEYDQQTSSPRRLSNTGIPGEHGVAASSASPVPSSGRELRTVPYDYEKIKDYEASEPPPSQGPAAIHGWAHNNNGKRNSASNKGGAAPVKVETTPEWDSNTLATATSTPNGSEDEKQNEQLLH